MFFLDKRRVVLILCFVFLFFSVYFAKSNSVQNRSFDITQVSAVPVTEKVIVVDAGHRSGRIIGAVGVARDFGV